jgi:hypothetical protein
MLVTADGVKWMTSALPRTIPEIESMIARASRELKISALDINLFDPQLTRPVVAGIDADRRQMRGGFAFVGSASEYALHRHQHATE